MHNSMQMDNSSITADSDYAGGQRPFSGPMSFSMDGEDNTRRSSAVGHPLAQPVSIPATNGLRYTQQPALQDVPFATSPTILMSPSDSCSETFSPASGSIYSHSPGLPYDRMPDFRSQRVPPLQPPTGISPSVQPQSTTVPGSAGLMGRNDYPGYTLQRGFPSLSSIGDMSRITPYSTTPRVLESTVDRTSQNLLFGQPGNIMMEPSVRLPQPIADAPPFHETIILHSIVSGSQTVKPEIQAKIHKGFFQVDEKWTCYRRNYFSVSCSFSLHPLPHSPLYIKYSDQATERVINFSMSISAIVNAQCGEVRELVQHTPKRDKQSEKKPPKIILQPSHPPPLILSHGPGAASGQHGFGLASQSTGMPIDYSTPYNSAPQPSQTPSQHTFERIQFQKATANNGKRRAQQQYYNLVVDLYAEVTSSSVSGPETHLVKIARKLSHPMVVRGRSPGHYKDGRRDSSTSMGPDGGSGGSGDGSGGAVLHPGIGPTARPHLTLMSYDSGQRGGSHYGRAEFSQMTTSDQSPLTGSPHISSSSSSAFDLLNDSMDAIDHMKGHSSMDSYQDTGYGIKAESQFRNHLPPFDYGSTSKHGDSSNSFAEPFDSMAPVMPNEQSHTSHFLKQPPRMAYHPSSTSSYDPVYSTRSNSGNSYPRFTNSQSLCA
ncbi:p53-like transcription factor [Aspergillus avenaceus]|uniref:p53-like transcription factor n=1 Tax=Aspergillus avenaceus TaxID=36643 RepID=A0A5N6TEI8_ASPAV|nr:p53-like transcription factor [Aspergillus avenaceus]